MKIIEKIRRYYENNNQKYGKGEARNLWAEPYRQQVRFEKIINLVDFSGKSICDVGCGYGDFYFFLNKYGIPFLKYTGIELLEEHCQVARERLPNNCEIICADFLSKDFGHFDILIASGVFNFYEVGWLEFTTSIINKMWQVSNDSIIFNIRSSYGDIKPAWIKPSFWTSYAEDKTKKFSLHHDYLMNDFTIIMSKK